MLIKRFMLIAFICISLELVEAFYYPRKVALGKHGQPYYHRQPLWEQNDYVYNMDSLRLPVTDDPKTSAADYWPFVRQEHPWKSSLPQQSLWQLLSAKRSISPLKELIACGKQGCLS